MITYVNLVLQFKEFKFGLQSQVFWVRIPSRHQDRLSLFPYNKEDLFFEQIFEMKIQCVSMSKAFGIVCSTEYKCRLSLLLTVFCTSRNGNVDLEQIAKQMRYKQSFVFNANYCLRNSGWPLPSPTPQLLHLPS